MSALHRSPVKEVPTEAIESSARKGGVAISPSTIHTVENAAGELNRFLFPPCLSDGVVPEAQHARVVWSISEQIKGLSTLIDELNGLPAPGPARDPAIGRFLLPLAIKAIGSGRQTSEEQLLVEAFHRTNTPRRDGTREVRVPATLAGAIEHTSLTPCNAELPGPLTYVALSKNGRAVTRFAELSGRIGEEQQAIDEMWREGLPAMEKKGVHPFESNIAIKRSKVAQLVAEIGGVFHEHVHDVSPESIPEVTRAVGVSATAHPEYLRRVCQMLRSIEGLCGEVFNPPPSGQSPYALQLVGMCRGGALTQCTLEISAEVLSRLKQDQVFLEHLFTVYRDGRELLLRSLNQMAAHPELGDVESDLFAALHPPFALLGSREGPTIDSILREAPAPITPLLLEMLDDYSLVDGGHRWGRGIETGSSVGPLRWCVKCALKGDPTLSARALEILRHSESYGPGVADFVSTLRALHSRGDVTGIATLFTRHIDRLTSEPERGMLGGVIASLSVVSRELAMAKELKNQISNVDQVRLLTTGNSIDEDRWGQTLGAIALDTLSSLTLSLADYYRDEGMAELWEALERYQILLDNPDILRGVAGNEGMKSGLMIVGGPGVGKTFFIQCLENHLGVPTLWISVEEAIRLAKEENKSDPNMSLLAACAFIVDKAKRMVMNNKGLILAIDEAEALFPRRDEPTTTPEQREIVGYMLQAINELRRDHPRVLVIAATNFIDHIDEAMLRPGRFDVRVVMPKPNPVLRQIMISERLLEEGVPLELSPEQMQELLDLSDGFIPIQITQMIVELNRLDRRIAQKRGEEFEFTFERLRDKFHRERERTVARGREAGA